MRGDRDHEAADGCRGASRPGSGLRTAGLTAGFLLAVLATVAVFVTDDPQVLRVAVVGAAWAFVLATLRPARRAPGDGDAGVRTADARETDLRLAAERDLAREVAARREAELRLESDLRREAEESVRTQLVELRADVSRLRAELSGQLAGEMPVERAVPRGHEARQPARPAVPRSGRQVPVERPVTQLERPPVPGSAETPPPGGSSAARRRRHRDDDGGGGKDVLSRVLGRS